MPLLTKIISGGQTGADRAGLDAAKESGIVTGGRCPKGFRTETGADPSLKQYGLTETDSSDYTERTKLNFLDSDGTVIFTDVSNGKITSRGSLLTLKTAKENDKPCIVNPTVAELVKWIKSNSINVLNVAGNRESTSPGIYERVKGVLTEALGEKLKENN